MKRLYRYEKAPLKFFDPDPVVPTRSNALRANRVADAFTAYAAEEKLTREDPETILVDFLTDLRHWCDGHGIDLNDYLDRSARAHKEEGGNGE
jgi:hypothetical protein